MQQQQQQLHHTQTLAVQIPADFVMPMFWSSLTPTECAFVLTTGCELIRSARTKVAGWTQQELEAKWKEQTKGELDKMEAALLLEKQKNKEVLEETKQFYQKQLERTQKELSEARMEYCRQQTDQQQAIQQQVRLLVDKECERYRVQLEERTTQLMSITEKYEKQWMQQQQLQQEQLLWQKKQEAAAALQSAAAVKSSKQLGEEGEEQACKWLQETFKDFVGYRLEKKAHQAHRGDFHLFFEEFNVLVDMKNYSGSVQKKELEKIEQDLALNETMDFAWLISLESNVSDWNRFPVMYKWLVTETRSKCIVIVNQLNAYAKPDQVMRNVWSTTKELHRLMRMAEGKGANAEQKKQLQELKERDFLVVQQIKTANKRMAEMKKALVQLTQTAKDMETDLVEALAMLTQDRVQKEIERLQWVKSLWEKHVVLLTTSVNPRTLSSTELWSKFHKVQEYKQQFEKYQITIDVFKLLLKQIVPVEQLVEKTRNGLLEFPCHQWNPAAANGATNAATTTIIPLEKKMDLDLWLGK